MSKFSKKDSSYGKDYTILVPSMLPIHFQLFVPIFEKYGYHIVILENEGNRIKEEGLMHVHNDTCYPALLVIGQFLDALKSGKYDLSRTALAITQTAGGCRASNYLCLLRKALAMEDLEYIPCLSLNFAGLEKENSIDLSVSLLTELLYGVLYGDALMWLYNQVKPYEIEKGITNLVLESLIEDIKKEFQMDTYKKSKRIYKLMIEAFKTVSRRNESKIRVGIVGEIYMKYSPIGNQYLIDHLVENGFEPVVTGVMDFGLYCIENGLIDHLYYHMHEHTYPLYKLAKRIILKMQKEFRDILSQEPIFSTPESFEDLMKSGKEIIDFGVKMGEGWLLTSEVVSLINIGVNNIVCAQPFGCLPNHIVAKGMIHKIKEMYPNSNVVPIDYDPSASKVNQENRIRLMLANAKLTEQWRRE